MCKMMISPDIFFHFLEIFIFRAVTGVKGQKIAKMKNNNYICHLPYLTNSITYDHDLWYTCVKWWYLQDFFSFFLKFSFFRLLGGKNSPKSKATILPVTCHTSGAVKHMIMIFGTFLLNDDISRCFFNCFEFLIFWAVRG